MYLTEPKLFDVVKRQYFFKMNANAASFTALIVMQIIALLISFNGSGYSSSPVYNQFPKIEWIDLSNDFPVALTLLWAFVLGLILTSAAQRNESFSFVTNRLSYHLSNFLFMVTASIIGGFTAALTGAVVKLYAFLRFDDVIVQTPGLIASPTDFSTRTITAIGYMLLFFLISYTIGSLVQRSMLFIPIFIVGWIALMSLNGAWNGEQYVMNIIIFFGNERSLPLFLIKICGTVLALFAVSTAITNRLEVRK